jgi:hypothetical protein
VTDSEESETCVDLTTRTIVPTTQPAITDNRDKDVVDEFELNRDDQMTEVDQSILDLSRVPNRYHRHIDKRENRYDLRHRVPQNPRVEGSRMENEAAENIVPEILNEHDNKKLSPLI